MALTGLTVLVQGALILLLYDDSLASSGLYEDVNLEAVVQVRGG